MGETKAEPKISSSHIIMSWEPAFVFKRIVTILNDSKPILFRGTILLNVIYIFRNKFQFCAQNSLVISYYKSVGYVNMNWTPYLVKYTSQDVY